MKKNKETPVEITHKLLIPSKIHVEPLLEAEGYTPSEVKRYAGWLYYTINLIEVYQITHFDADNYNGYSLINFDLLGKVVGQGNVKLTKDFLLKHNIIESNGIFKSQSKHGKGVSSGYRITAQFVSPVVTSTIYNKFIIKKLQNKSWQNSYDVRAKAGQYIHSMMRRYIRIRRKPAEAYVNAKFSQSEALLKQLIKDDRVLEYGKASIDDRYYHIKLTTIEEILDKGSVSDLFNLIARMYHRDLNSIIRIDKKDFSTSEGETGRIYTNITSMSSGVRKFLYHREHKKANLINIDIKNSQPFLLNRLLKTHYQRLGQELPEDVERYIRLTSKGKLYETVMKALNLDYEDKALRRWFKGVFFGKILYCKNTTTAKSPEGKAFKKLFPSVAKFIRTMKAGEAKDSYKRLAQEMQRVESKIMIKVIARELQKQRIWCSTIHDSVLVLPEDVKSVKGIIKTKFDIEYDLKPALDDEELIPVEEKIEIEICYKQNALDVLPLVETSGLQIEKTIEEMDAEFFASFDDDAFKRDFGLSIHDLPF